MKAEKDKELWSSVSFAGNRRKQTIELAKSTTAFQRISWVCEASEFQRALQAQARFRSPKGASK